MKQRSNFTTKTATEQLDRNMSEAISRWFQNIDLIDLFENCAGCHHMEQKGPAFCKKYQRTPPVQVIVGAIHCDGFSDDEEIPF